MSDLDEMLRRLAEKHHLISLDFSDEEDRPWTSWTMPDKSSGIIYGYGLTPIIAVRNLIEKLEKGGKDER